MFTGLVEARGVVAKIVKGAKSAQMTIKAPQLLEGTRLGDSIATNGVCLTVTHLTETAFTVDVMPETMSVTGLGELMTGSFVNLERALKLEDRLGGHIVSGHIDGIGVIQQIKAEDNATWLTLKAPENILRYIIHKGSIAIDGVSLTVAYVDAHCFKVSLIPLTKSATTLPLKKVGERVNLECDVIGKYIEKLMMSKQVETKEPISTTFLMENGFL